MNNKTIIASYIAAGYPEEYIILQQEKASRHLRNGTRPDGESSDMECDFYCNSNMLSDRDQKKGHKCAPPWKRGGVFWLAIQLAIMVIWTAVTAWLWSTTP